MAGPYSPADLLAFAGAVASGAVRVVDLTQTLTPEFPVIVLPPEFGQAAPFRMEEISRYDERGPGWYWNNFTMSEHTGTHFDAPIHWITGRDMPDASVDTIPPANFVAPACVVDVSAQCAEDPDFTLNVDHLLAWEQQHGKIPERSWVLLRTDWSKLPPRGYANMKEDGAHTPGPSPEAMKWLVEERDVHGFGTETIGTDHGQATHFNPPHPAHYYIHGAGKYGLQCLCNLDQLPPKGAVIFSAPLKIKQGSGSPLRVLALVANEGARA